MTYRFGPFVADRTAYRVSRGEVPLELTPKLLDVLFYLLDRPATLVTKEELLDEVWPGANVTDNALAQAMSDLRDALGDSPATPTYIRTVARRGYRFVAPIETSRDGRARIAPPSAATSPAPLPPGGLAAVAVLDFANVTDDPDIAWLRAGIAETVTSDLGRLDHFRVIDRWRVVQAARRTDGSMHEMAAALDASLLVTGSYQRVGPLLRITARLVDLTNGEAIADAKVDGPLEDVFSLQDGIVAAFARDLGVPGIAHPHAAGRARDVQPRGLPRLYGGLAEDREPRHRSGPGRHRRLHARDRARPALRDRVRRARERGVRRLRDDAHGARAERARRSRRASSTRRTRPSSIRAWPKRTRRCRSCSRAPAASTRRGRPRTPPSRSSRTAGVINTASATRSGATRGCAPSSAR